MRIRYVFLSLVIAGCVHANSTTCADDGAVCPEGTVCVPAMATSGMVDLCVEPGQLTCANMPDGTACAFDGKDATCHGGGCIPDACGNGLLDHDEACDDGNNSSGDGCSADCTSNETCGNGHLDPATEECDDGNAITHDLCSSNCRVEAPLWQPVVPMPARSAAAMAYDARRHRTVVFGGLDTTTSARLDDTREWNGQRWDQVTAPVSPLGRRGHAIAYDADKGQIVLFGELADTWTFDEHGWTVRAPAHTPPVRIGGTMVYDGKHRRVVLFGGIDATVNAVGDTWAWDGTDWTDLGITGPSPRAFQAMAYDPKRGVVVLFGGLDGALAANGETWELDGSTWSRRAMTAPPAARYLAQMAWDPTHEQVMLIGGSNGAALDDVWEWNGTAWTQLAQFPNNTGELVSASIATDFGRNRIVLLGATGTTWEHDGTTWTQIQSTGTGTPSARYDHVAETDPRRREIVVFGGVTYRPAAAIVGDSYVFDGLWSSFGGTTHPSARRGAAMVYDPVRDEMILFGGCSTFQGDPNLVANAETWAYRHRPPNPPTWTKLTPAASPSARCDHAMAWDGVHQQIVLFGGQLTASTGSAETWLWNGTTWSPTTPAMSPAPRSGSHLAWDQGRRKLVLFGGDGSNITLQDAWELDDTGWKLVPQQDAPPARTDHALVGAPDGAGVIAIGGRDPQPSPEVVFGDLVRLRWDSPRAADETCTAVDTDGDGVAGCGDPDCAPVCTPACSIGVAGCTPAVKCGDLTCDPELESCDSCPTDCGACPVHCGDGTCDAGETTATCPGDCPP